MKVLSGTPSFKSRFKDCHFHNIVKGNSVLHETVSTPHGLIEKGDLFVLRKDLKYEVRKFVAAGSRLIPGQLYLSQPRDVYYIYSVAPDKAIPKKLDWLMGDTFDEDVRNPGNNTPGEIFSLKEWKDLCKGINKCKAGLRELLAKAESKKTKSTGRKHK